MAIPRRYTTLCWRSCSAPTAPPEIAGAFRALATIEGTLTQLAPGFDILSQARRFTTDHLAEQLSPDALRKSVTDELISLIPMLRRLPRRLDRIGGSLQRGELGLNVRLLADQSDANTSPNSSTS